jgi:hypothetical protein
MKIRQKKFAMSIIGAGLLVLCSSAQAFDVRGTAKFGLDFGGDTLVTVLFTDGSTSSIKANAGLYLGGGVALVTDDKTITTEITLSWKQDNVTASNADVTFTRYPLDALVFYNMERVRVGGGLTYHMSPKLRSSGFAPNPTADYDNAVGTVLGADYRYNQNGFLGLRYTSLEYSGAGLLTKKTNGLGIVLGATF